MTNENIYNDFKPTYLMIKQHKITGLKYFCKTIGKYPYSYLGSGTDWIDHIQEHGKLVETIWCRLFENKIELKEFAEFFSEEFNIVKSPDWANLKIENGLDGFESSKSSEVQNKRIKDGSHHFLSGEITRKQIENGTHSFLGGELQRNSNNKRIKDGTHHWLKKNRTIYDNGGGGDTIEAKIKRDQQLLEGTHNFQKGIQKIKASRPIYLEVKVLYKSLGLKIPTNTFMRSDDYLFLIKKELLTKKI